jgi:hypothetical protein
MLINSSLGADVGPAGYPVAFLGNLFGVECLRRFVQCHRRGGWVEEVARTFGGQAATDLDVADTITGERRLASEDVRCPKVLGQCPKVSLG